MGWALSEVQKLDLPLLMKGIVPTIIEESPLLGGVDGGEKRKALTFQTINSTGQRINRELTLPVSDWYVAGDTITSSETTYTQVTHTLSTVITQRDINDFMEQASNGQQPVMKIALQEMTKSLTRKVEQRIIYGDNSTNTKEPSGLHLLLGTNAASSAQVVYGSADATPDAGTLLKLRQVIDLVKPGRPDMLLMSRQTLRNISAYGSALQSPVQFEVSSFGRRVPVFDDIPIAISDYVSNTENIDSSGLFTASTGGTATSIFALKFGDRAFTGYEHGAIQHIPVGVHQSKDAHIHRMRWYVGFNFKSILAGAAYTGISNAIFTNS